MHGPHGQRQRLPKLPEHELCFGGGPGGAIRPSSLDANARNKRTATLPNLLCCTGGDVILPRRDQVLIRCAENNSNGTVLEFAMCAAPTAGSN